MTRISLRVGPWRAAAVSGGPPNATWRSGSELISTVRERGWAVCPICRTARLPRFSELDGQRSQDSSLDRGPRGLALTGVKQILARDGRCEVVAHAVRDASVDLGIGGNGGLRGRKTRDERYQSLGPGGVLGVSIRLPALSTPAEVRVCDHVGSRIVEVDERRSFRRDRAEAIGFGLPADVDSPAPVG